jgi:glycerophosphoryl diester phosphodiesterase
VDHLDLYSEKTRPEEFMFRKLTFMLVGLMAVVYGVPHTALAGGSDWKGGYSHAKTAKTPVQLGPRPFFLVDQLEEGRLKRKLQRCADKRFKKSDFSIGHRGACMQFPEHTKESYMAAARQGAGIIECDVTFTKDKQLVCRHSQCDLHTTTNIVNTPLGDKCSEPFAPAEYDAAGNVISPASALCCTSDITLEEFKTLKGKMDAANPAATTPEEYLGGTANWRTDLYSGPTSGTLMTHSESIELFKKLGVKMTPELKSPSVEMDSVAHGTEGYTQDVYAQQMIDEYKAAGVKAKDVFPQSFNYYDVRYWIENEPAFGKQAVYLDGRAYGERPQDQEDYPDFDPNNPSTWEPRSMDAMLADGVNYVAPPMWVLLTTDVNGEIVPSEYAKAAKAAGLKIITWTLERSGILGDGEGGWYYQTTQDALSNEGDILHTLDVLARDVGIEGIFSDWPATVTYYANCVKPKKKDKWKHRD